MAPIKSPQCKQWLRLKLALTEKYFLKKGFNSPGSSSSMSCKTSTIVVFVSPTTLTNKPIKDTEICENF